MPQAPHINRYLLAAALPVTCCSAAMVHWIATSIAHDNLILPCGHPWRTILLQFAMWIGIDLGAILLKQLMRAAFALGAIPPDSRMLVELIVRINILPILSPRCHPLLIAELACQQSWSVSEDIF